MGIGRRGKAVKKAGSYELYRLTIWSIGVCPDIDCYSKFLHCICANDEGVHKLGSRWDLNWIEGVVHNATGALFGHGVVAVGEALGKEKFYLSVSLVNN